MSSSAAIFSGGFAEVAGDPLLPLVREAGAELEAAIRVAVEAGRNAWPSLALEQEVFVSYLGRCTGEALAARGARAGGILAALRDLDPPSLYLVCAAGHGVAAAIEIISATMFGPALAAVRRVDKEPAFVDEVIQILRKKLFVSEGEGRPKILSFSGRASLASWIAVVAQRVALSSRRSSRDQERLQKRVALETAIVERDPELRYMKGRYAAAFATAIQGALAKLGDRERTLLRLHNVNGLTLERLASIYSVNDATISRWLAKARAWVANETGRQMRDALGIRSGEFPSLARALTSQIDVSIARWLASSSSSDPPRR